MRRFIGRNFPKNLLYIEFKNSDLNEIGIRIYNNEPPDSCHMNLRIILDACKYGGYKEINPNPKEQYIFTNEDFYL